MHAAVVRAAGLDVTPGAVRQAAPVPVSLLLQHVNTVGAVVPCIETREQRCVCVGSVVVGLDADSHL